MEPGEIWLITGCSSGFGAGIARQALALAMADPPLRRILGAPALSVAPDSDLTETERSS